MATDFKSLLSKKVDDAERPKILPAGTWEGFVKAFEYSESQEKKTPMLNLQLGISSPGEDITSEELEGIDYAKRTLRFTFYLTPDADWRLKDFLKSCGIETTGKSFGETVPDAVNAPVLMSVVQTPSRTQEGEFYNNVQKIVGTAEG
jgi:hypothetical protein